MVYFQKIAQIFQRIQASDADILALQQALLTQVWQYFSAQEAENKHAQFLQHMQAQELDSTPFLPTLQQAIQAAKARVHVDFYIPPDCVNHVFSLLEYLLAHVDDWVGKRADLADLFSSSILNAFPEKAPKIGAVYAVLQKIAILFTRAQLSEAAAFQLQKAWLLHVWRHTDLRNLYAARFFLKKPNIHGEPFLPLLDAKIGAKIIEQQAYKIAKKSKNNTIEPRDPQAPLALLETDKRFIVFDTSALMKQPDILKFLENQELAIIPKRVQQELYGLQSHENAATAAQALAALTTLKIYQKSLRFDGQNHVNLLPLTFDPTLPDNEILASALFYRANDVLFLSRDVDLLRRAQLLQLSVQHSEHWYATREHM